MIKFSIITVCLNAGNDLLETVESTLKQSYSEFEIIVKDGFSKDESICKLPQDKRIHLVQKRDTGIYDAMNQGIEVAQGDYMIFMNAGDKFYDSEVLKRIADGIEETSGDLYYGRLRLWQLQRKSRSMARKLPLRQVPLYPACTASSLAVTFTRTCVSWKRA